LTNDIDCQFDFHLILNALSCISLEAYRVTGHESPVVLLLSDYIKAEYGIARGREGVASQGRQDEHWHRCETVIRLSAALLGINVRPTARGTPDPDYLPLVARIIPRVLKAWLPARGSQIDIGIEFGADAIRIAGRNASSASDNRPSDPQYLESALRLAQGGEGLPGKVVYMVISQTLRDFEFELHKFP
jgi:hypothetical protein